MMMLVMEVVVVVMVVELAVMVSIKTMLNEMIITNSTYDYSFLTQHIAGWHAVFSSPPVHSKYCL